MASVDPLVSKDAPQLEDPLVAPDHQPLQPELGRDAQEELAVERVVERPEGACGGAGGDRVQHRRLDLHEVRGPAALAHRSQHLAAARQRRTRRRVGPQVRLAVPVAQVEVRDPGPLVAEVVQGLGEELPRRDLDRELAALRAHDLAAHADPVTQVQFRELLEPLGGGRQGEELDLAAGVTHRGEGQLALGAHQHQPAGDVDRDARLLAVAEVRVRRPQCAGEGVVGKGVWRGHDEAPE